jgi:hypothetical protein
VQYVERELRAAALGFGTVAWFTGHCTTVGCQHDDLDVVGLMRGSAKLKIQKAELYAEVALGLQYSLYSARCAFG